MRVLFVCTGNTCRSPMAEALLRAQSIRRGMTVEAASAGLFAEEGAPMSFHASLALEELQADARGHAARQLTREMAEQADLILTMTASHLSQVLRQLPEHAQKAHTLKAYAAGNSDNAQSGQNDIDDPFGGSLEAYRACAREIAQSIGALLDRLQGELKTP